MPQIKNARHSMMDEIKPNFKKSASSQEIHSWDDPYWQEKTPIALIVHSLAQKHKDVEENHLAKRKEIVSDTVPALVGLYEQSIPLLAFTALAGVIVYTLHAQAKTSDEEYHELLKIWAEYKNNDKDENREYAENIVKERISEMNIKLSDIHITDIEELNIAMSYAEKQAKERGLIPHKKVTAKDVQQMDGRLKQVANKYGKAITNNIVSPVLDTMAFYVEATKSCFADLKSPGKAFDGVADGVTTSKAIFTDRRSTRQRREERKHHKEKVKFIKRKTAELPKSTVIKANIALEAAKRYSDIIENIEDYNPKQGKALLGFGFATGLAGVGLIGLGASGAESVYAVNGLEGNILQIGAGIWGLALGIGSWGQTGGGAKYYHDALHGERALEAQEHKSLAKSYKNLVEGAKRNKDKPRASALPINWRSDRADLHVLPRSQDDNTPS